MRGGREFLVGLVIIVALAIGVGGTLWLQGRTFGPIFSVEVLTESVGQLAEGNAVLPDGSGVRMTMVLENTVALPSDPAVILAPESLFGAWQAEIVSHSSYPSYPFFELPPGTVSETPVMGGYALPELSRLSRSAEQIADNLESLTTRLELAFTDETAANLSSAIENIQEMTTELRRFVSQQSEVASSITANADSALAEVELAARAARRTFARVEGIVGDAGIDSILTNIREASAGIRDVATVLADADTGFPVTLQHIDSTFARLDRITARVEAGDGSIGRLLADSTFAVRAEEVLRQMDLLLEDLRENPRRYVRLSIF
jgi:phospholipid/cholesterol/gamma-HCH transport system substrate-binding protein